MFKRKRAITNTNNKVCIDNVKLDKCSNTKYLGIYIDENLNWSAHINYLIRNASKLVPILYQVRNNTSGNSLKLLYNSIIYPFIYGNIIWGYSPKIKLNPLIVLQKNVRILSFKNRYKHTAPLFRDFNFLPVEQINKYMNVIFVHKCLNSVNNLFRRYSLIHYNTRLGNASVLTLPNIVSTHSRQSVRWVGCSCWNSLPQHIREIQNYNSIKLKAKLHYVTQGI